MKKILVFGITENPGGIESVIMNYYRHIDRKKIQFDFLCNTEKVSYEKEINALGGKIYRITARSQNTKKFKKDMENFFVKHANEYFAIWVNVCSLANIDYLKYAKKYGISKRIIHAHNSQNMDSFLRGILHRFNRILIGRYATDFWTCSDEASKWFYSKKIINSSKYVIIKNAINCDIYKFDKEIRDNYRKQFNIESDELVIGNVGRMHFQKNQEYIIKIFNDINKSIPKSKLFLVGDGPDKGKIEKLIKEYKQQNNIILLGVRDDVNCLMQMFDVFLFPSLFEGLPLAPIEAQAASLPVYLSKGRISSKVIINKKLIHFIDLDEGANRWANIIINTYKNYDRNLLDMDLIRKSGYDIITEAQKLERLLVKEGKYEK
ncbi:capsular polysaccharide biosynthesis protein Cps4H [Clostridium sp. CAG:440]|jgi:glycosyltransferase involved in cell wall biosynthesis|nr:capsular polysaccharide biosynthesis protein Cps4H [Clostridium sp. CAG:440]